MDSHAQKLRNLTRRDSSLPSPTSSRKSLQNIPQPTRPRQTSILVPTGDPEPSTLFGPGEPISQWRKEEIHALPQELRTQCLLTMQTRKRQAAQIPDRSLITTPQEVTAATSQESATVRCMFGSDINASCFAERERARQMEILMVMWSRG